MKKLLILLSLLLSFQSVEALSGASYDSKSFAATVQDANIYCLDFKTDGSIAYVCGNVNDRIFQYTIGTPWDASTGSYASKSCSVGSQTADPHGVAFKTSDGTKMYVAGNNTLYQYSLSTPWDVSTCSYDSVSLSVNSQDTSFREIFWKDDGLSLYGVGVANDRVYQYSCSSAWVLSSCSYTSKFLGVGTQDGLPAGLVIRSDGLKVYMIGGGRIFYRYGCTGAWDMSTCTYDTDSYNATAQGLESATGLAFKPDGTKMYYDDRLTQATYQYSSAETWPDPVVPKNTFFGTEI